MGMLTIDKTDVFDMSLLENPPQEEVIVTGMLTPQGAQAFLDKNVKNRIARNSLITRYANGMVREVWLYTGDAIRFDKNGDLIDGQHRCAAIIKSGVPQYVTVVMGLDPRVQEVIDKGSNRSQADTLSLRDQDAKKSGLVPLLNAYYQWAERGMRASLFAQANRPEDTELTDYFEDNRALLLQSWWYADQVTKRGVAHTTRKVWGVAAGLFIQVDPAATKDFFDLYMSGNHDSDTEPIWYLRERLSREFSSKKKDRPRDNYVLALIISAWNMWRDGEQVSRHIRLPNLQTNYPEPH